MSLDQSFLHFRCRKTLIHFREVFSVKVISPEIHFDPPTWNSRYTIQQHFQSFTFGYDQVFCEKVYQLFHVGGSK